MAIVSAMLALVAWTFAVHSGFVPAVPVREAAPVLGLIAAASYVHAVARVRAERDADPEVDRVGRALFLGSVMLVVALLGWLVFAQSLPVLYTCAFGDTDHETVTVLRRIPFDASSADCAYRLEVRRVNVDRALDVCVARGTWEAAAAGALQPAEVRASMLGAEVVSVLP